jgi:hypothetical protein
VGVVVMLVVLVAVMSSSKKKAGPASQAQQQAAARPLVASGSRADYRTDFVQTPTAQRRRRGGRARAVLKPTGKLDGKSGRDERYVQASCGACNAKLSSKATNCPSCGASLKWEEEIQCPFCSTQASDGKRGYCAYCNGTMKNPSKKAVTQDRLPFGMSRSGRTGLTDRCPVCAGSGKCMKCRGTQVVPVDDVLWFGGGESWER